MKFYCVREQIFSNFSRSAKAYNAGPVGPARYGFDYPKNVPDFRFIWILVATLVSYHCPASNLIFPHRGPDC